MATHSNILAWRIPGMEAWWAAVYGVAQSRTRLRWLSSLAAEVLVTDSYGLRWAPWIAPKQASGFGQKKVTLFIYLFSEVSLNLQDPVPLSMLSCFSRDQLCATPWTVAHQAPLSIECSRQGYWSGLPFPSPGDLLDPGIEPTSFMPPALAGGFFTTSTTWEAWPSQRRPFNFKVITVRVFVSVPGSLLRLIFCRC